MKIISIITLMTLSVSAKSPALYTPTVAPEVQEAAVTPAAPALTEATSNTLGVVINANVYTSSYNVRGMSVNDHMSAYGFSSIGASYALPEFELFGMDIQHEVSADLGVIWGAGDSLSTEPLSTFRYMWTKEVYPNLQMGGGYQLRYGGLEGYMAKHYNNRAHQMTQDVVGFARYDTGKEGVFGEALVGVGFQGLLGVYGDLSGGYRFTGVCSVKNVGFDVELEAGLALSYNYWVGKARGVDAFRLRATLAPYSLNGTFGRDANFTIAPWVQAAWSGDTADDIKTYTYGHDIVDDFKVTVGIECSYKF